MAKQKRKTISLLREFSIPLISGVLIALIWANAAPASYHHFVDNKIWGDFTLHFFVNDLFMVFFFAIAAVEITQSLLPGGDLNPLKRAINPMMATLGGIAGPALLYLALNTFMGSQELVRGWGIPTATDIALAWLVARLVFGAAHPAVSFLLLLAIADDGIGLIIIALFYPDPANPVVPVWLLCTLAGMLIALALKKGKVKSYWPYILLGGALSWTGLYRAGIHPSLALVFIVPFLPHSPGEKAHLFEDDPEDYSTLRRFEQEWKFFVDMGLFLFGLTNAGVEFSAVSTVTWLVFLALLFGKTAGIFLLGSLASFLGFPLPEGMRHRELLVAGLIASIGLTVALFIAGVAFSDPGLQGAAKMGALWSVSAVIIAVSAGRLLGIERKTATQEPVLPVESQGRRTGEG
ncbi:sodium/proton antiporter, NhaA family [Syntrophobotulus glycolicus DSM 8271]|uniref:Na(+)/H(+) antiporter NhaA n=1 Tax=Syntrophobotulus glycolicus (strain DSM 8271 / FlGlyR) TaxID=645991 RepID=F0SUM3_SYNGF|nr:Na+/H+ antiporter NhaA [Syntrophobotulus glycolicus]ADY55516.1 sodium/proton antiporter, NhaA family [Syntrophobotulus glycolicus DSM 8271]